MESISIGYMSWVRTVSHHDHKPKRRYALETKERKLDQSTSKLQTELCYFVGIVYRGDRKPSGLVKDSVL
jgi:hypothetical protein